MSKKILVKIFLVNQIFGWRKNFESKNFGWKQIRSNKISDPERICIHKK